MDTSSAGIRMWLGAAVLALAACARQPAPQQVDAAAPAVTGARAQMASSAPATAPAPSVGTAPGRAAAQAGGSAGVRVFIDPATGEAREPTRAEAAAASAAASAGRVQAAGGVGQAASEGVQREHFVLPDGTEGVKLLPSDQHAVVVCRQADGSFGSHCPRTTGAATP